MAALLAMDGRMEESEWLLFKTRTLCAKSEQIGSARLEAMGRQREQIERAGDLPFAVKLKKMAPDHAITLQSLVIAMLFLIPITTTLLHTKEVIPFP